MKKEFKVKEFGAVKVAFIATDGETEVEAEASFENVEDALKVISDITQVESVEIDPKEEESTTKFNLKKHESQEPSSDKIAG